MPAPKLAIAICDIRSGKTKYVGYDDDAAAEALTPGCVFATAEGLRTAEAAAGAVAARQRHGVFSCEWRIPTPKDLWGLV